jgi:four helix bundle protein
MKSFEDLDVWKESVKLSAEVYIFFDGSKDFGFKDQITRSALSIPSNIAEGCERESLKDRRKFFNYAKGSSGELQTQIQVGLEAGFINAEKANEWIGKARKFSAMLHGLIQYLNKSIS